MKALQEKCNEADVGSSLNLKNGQAILLMFSHKKASKMTKYLKELLNLDNHLHKDKKLMKKVFEDKAKYFNFVRDNLMWMLQNTKYAFT